MRPLAGLLLLVPLTMLPAWAQDGLEVRATLQPTRVEIGRTLTLQVEVRAREGVSFTPPPAEALQVPPLEVRDAVLVALEPEPGRRGWRYTLRLAAWEPGTVTLPPLRFGSAQSQSLDLEVAPAPAEPRGEILEAPAPPPPAIDTARLALAGTAGLAGALLLAFLTRRWWEPRRSAPPAPEQPLLDRLEGLLVEDRPAEERLVALGGLLRAELERRHGWPAGRYTTAEMGTLLHQHEQAWVPLLEEADLARFARHRPEASRLSTLVEQARNLLQDHPC